MRIKLLITLILTFMCFGCVYDNYDDQDIDIGSSMPAFQAIMSDGTIINTSVLDDKPWIIIFFNTSCSDCRRELPLIQQFYDEYSLNTHFLVIAREEDETSIKQFWNSNNFTMPYSPQSNRYIYSLFAQSGIPRMYIVNKWGIIIDSIDTILSYSEISSSIH